MVANFQYAWYVARHKYFVFIAGRKIGVPLWQLIIHDWSKLTPREWRPYVDRFYRGGGQDGFDAAWLHHQNRNPHHWEYWLRRKGREQIVPVDIPERYLLEMVADWAGAGRAINGRWELLEWLEKNSWRMRMTTQSWYRVNVLAGELQAALDA